MATFGIYVVPVVDRNGKVIGAVTAWDVLHAYLYGPKEGREDVEVKTAVEVPVSKPSMEAVIRLKPVKHVTGLRARDVMLSDVPMVNVRDPLSSIRKAFLRSKSGILAVVDDSGKVVGFITRRDFMSYRREVLGVLEEAEGKTPSSQGRGSARRAGQVGG